MTDEEKGLVVVLIMGAVLFGLTLFVATHFIIKFW
jgi:hypothetical protein